MIVLKNFLYFFQSGSGFNNVGIQLIELASQAISAEDVDAGDSFTMKFVMDFPAIPSVDKSDLKIELFAMDPSIGKEINNMIIISMEYQSYLSHSLLNINFPYMWILGKNI